MNIHFKPKYADFYHVLLIFADTEPLFLEITRKRFSCGKKCGQIPEMCACVHSCVCVCVCAGCVDECL